MEMRRRIGHRYFLSCILSASAALLGIINPFLTGLLVARAKESFTISNIMPVFICLAAVKASRIYFRVTIAKLLGGSQRAPFIWLRHRIGRWLWWIEPLLHNWGWVGMVVTRFSGGTSVPSQIASGLIYYVTDTGITIASGIVYYFTDSYTLSFLSILVLPTLIVIPWFTKKSATIREFSEKRRKFKVKKGQIK